jgi:hypothetical protein
MGSSHPFVVFYFANLIGSWAAEADRHKRQVPGSPMVTHLSLNHSVDCAEMEMHMLVQTGSEAMNESHGADAQGSFICLFRNKAVFMQAQVHDLQENAQRALAFL